MRSIALWQAKGGCAKTTTAVNLAIGLARRGKRVLAVDTDSQANASLVLLEGRPAEAPTLAHVLMGAAESPEAIRGTHVAGLDVLPADGQLAEVNVALAGELGRERRLRLALADVAGAYDFVILDTPPSQSLVVVNVLNFAEELLVPVDPGLFSLAGLGKLQADAEQVRRYLDNRRLHIAGVVLTRAQANNVSRDVEAQLRGLLGDLVHRAVVPLSTKVEEAHSRYQSVMDYAPRSAGAKAYAALLEEILDDGRARAQDGAGDAAGGSAEADDAGPDAGRAA